MEVLMRPCPQCGTLVPRSQCPSCHHVLPSEGSVLGKGVTPLKWAVLGLTVLAGCDDGGAVALYGVPCTDDDADGYCLESGDCDDDDASIHPDAVETAGDGIDANCDGADDT